MTTDQPAQGSTANYCSRWPGEPHAMVTHLRGGALVSVRRCSSCGWIDFGDLDEQVRAHVAEGRRQATEGARSGYDAAIATLTDVADRTGSVSARYWADYLTVDPDRRAPAAATVGPWEPAEQPEPAPEQAKARAVARELLRIIPEAIRADIARGVDDDDNRLLLAEVFEAARPLVGNPVARPLVLPVAKLAQRMYAAATAEQPNVQLDDRLDTRERCPSCSRPATSIRDQGGDGLTVARKWLPCGCTRIVPVGGDRG